MGLAHARPPRVPPHPGRRGHHRPARPGLRQRRSASRIAEAQPARALRRRGRATTTCSCICSDGDLEEGISHEAASLAGHLGLGRLVYVYDDNHITIDGPTELALQRRRPPSASRPTAGTSCSSARSPTTSTRSRPGSARAWPRTTGRRSSCCAATSATRRRSTPTPRRRTATRSAPTRSRAVKEILGLPPDETSSSPTTCSILPRGRRPRRERARGVGAATARRRGRAGPRRVRRVPRGRAASPAGSRSCRRGRRASRSPPATAMRRRARRDRRRRARAGRRRRRPHRQHRHEPSRTPACSRHARPRRAARSTSASASTAWARSMNGMAVHGGAAPVRRHVLRVQRLHARPRCGSPRSARPRSCSSWTHDSVGVGEDGPTHQPVEQLASLRAMPGLRVIRPADANETAQAWRVAHRRRRARPRCILTRQKRPGARRHRRARTSGVPAGAYVLVDEDRRRPDLVLIGTGSEVSRLRRRRATCSPTTASSVRVVSMPSWDLFAAQSDDVPRRGAAARRADARGRGRRARFGWERYADDVVGIDRFGASAPGDVVLRELGFTPEHVVERARALLEPQDSSTERTSHDAAIASARTIELRAEPLVRQPHARLRSRAAGCRSWSTTTASAASRRTRRSSRRRSAPATTTTSSSATCVDGGASIEDAYWELVIDDIGTRADVLRPVLRRAATAATASCRSRCRPTSRTTPTATIEQAARAARARRPPNVMIKIPATAEGSPRSQQTIARASTSTSR